MIITIENCSSAGAHFSENTNDVLIKIHKWIKKNDNPSLRFIEFRRRLEKEMQINDNNARNIYPLLKNCGFVEYRAGDELDTLHFFTPKGEAYVLGLESIAMIAESEYTEKQIIAASQEMKNLLQNLIYEGLLNLFKNKELNYREGMRWFLEYLLEFKKIDKYEFAYMVYQMENNQNNWQESVRSVINDYREKKISIDVKIRVRNDQKIQEMTGETTRLEGISFFTAFSFYSALFLQAGLTNKIGSYHYINLDMERRIKKLLEA